MSTRIRGELFNKLSQAARDNDRPLGNEVEWRLEQTFAKGELLGDVLDLRFGSQLAGVLLLLGDVMLDAAQRGIFAQTHTMSGIDNWLSNGPVYNQAANAARAILDALEPPGADADIPFLYGREGDAGSEALNEENRNIGKDVAADMMLAVKEPTAMPPLQSRAAAVRSRLQSGKGK